MHPSSQGKECSETLIIFLIIDNQNGSFVAIEKREPNEKTVTNPNFSALVAADSVDSLKCI